MKLITYIFSIILIATACDSNEVVQEEAKEKVEIEKDLGLLDFDSIADESIAYTQNRDLDGDGIGDEIYFDFTGGAHCCYLLSLDLSTQDSLFTYPFEMDGGYIFDVDGSLPDHFRIEDFDKDGLPEIFMEIYTYNGEITPVEKEWTRDYGITTNYILFDFKEGAMQVRDYQLEKEL